MDLISFRKSRGLSQEQAANELGLGSKGYISSIESGTWRCPLKLALKIERWSDGAVPADGLVSDEDRALLATHRELATSPEARP